MLTSRSAYWMHFSASPGRKQFIMKSYFNTNLVILPQMQKPLLKDKSGVGMINGTKETCSLLMRFLNFVYILSQMPVVSKTKYSIQFTK